MKKAVLFLGLIALAVVVVYVASIRHPPNHAQEDSQAHPSSPSREGALSEEPDVPGPSLPSNRNASVATEPYRDAVAKAIAVGGLPERLRDLESAAPTDPNAFLALESLRSVCQSWSTASQNENDPERSTLSGWKILEEICTAGAKERFEQVLASADRTLLADVMPQPWKHRADSAEEFAARDARLQESMRRASSAAGAFSAAIVYFDYERFAQWAGSFRPLSIHDDRSYLRSRIGLDVAWMYACRLGLDCGPYAGLTLMECWQTPGCVPGGAARQVVQMRRSPLELRLVDSMVDRLMTERASAER